MKQGIHLGPPPRRAPGLATAMLLAAVAAALVLGVLYQRARADIRSLALEVEDLEAALPEASPGASTADDGLVSARLLLALDSGASSSLPPTALLHLVDSTLPDGVALTRISFGPSPSPSLTLEASAASGDRVTELQRRLAASPLVATTSLLEERRLPDGRLSIRLQLGVVRK